MNGHLFTILDYVRLVAPRSCAKNVSYICRTFRTKKRSVEPRQTQHSLYLERIVFIC